MAGHPSFTWLSYVPFIGELPPQVSGALFVLLTLSLLAYVAFRKIVMQAPVEMVPSSRFSLRNLFELFTEIILKFLDDIIGPRGREFLPLIGTLGFFILFSNLMGLVPGFLPPTDNLNTTVACALVVFCATHYYGVKAHGLKYLKHFLGPVLWLSPLFVIIEVISHLARVLSLSMRLFGNIMADHMLLSLTLLTPSLLVLFLPPLAMFMGIFVSLIQTFIFMLLSMVYLSLAIEEGEH
ncbi:MAG: F0F1 ATP synthase subunit A [Deltaproteobacteria bacterium]|nr:F0F1 ATP synthase subunit A [Deltaproteobacteria bacterium]